MINAYDEAVRLLPAKTAAALGKEAVSCICGGSNSQSNTYGNGDNLTVLGFFGFSEKAHDYYPPCLCYLTTYSITYFRQNATPEIKNNM